MVPRNTFGERTTASGVDEAQPGVAVCVESTGGTHLCRTGG